MKVSAARRNASAVIAVLALLGILSLYVLVNARTIVRLKHDVRQIEARQLQRLQARAAIAPTRSLATTNSSYRSGIPFSAPSPTAR